MEEEVQPTQPVEDVKEEVKEDKGFRLNPNRPLKGQVDQLLKSLPEEEKKDEVEEPTKKNEEKAPEKAEEIPEEVELEDLPEETKFEPLPEWQQYILDKLPNIQVMGHQGEEGKDKVFTVKRLEDLPDDFEFASKRAELAFNAALASQEVNARDLLNQYRTEEARRSQADFEALEATDIQNDVKSLQKAGILPKFKYEVNDPRFNSDPAVEESNKIYDFYKKINDDYFNKYNGSGRMYRVSYEDAAYRYYALHPKEATKEVKEAIKKEEAKSENQAQREKVASKVSAPQGATAEGMVKPLPRGTDLNKVYKLYKMGRI